MIFEVLLVRVILIWYLKGIHSKEELYDNAELTMKTQKLGEMRRKQLQYLKINNLNYKQELPIL